MNASSSDLINTILMISKNMHYTSMNNTFLLSYLIEVHLVLW